MSFPLTYTINGVNFPCFPGAWLVCNNGAASTADNLVFPVYTSISDFTTDYNADLGVDNSVDNVLVLPGFKLTCYIASNYTSTNQTFDNSDGKIPVSYNLNDDVENKTTSVKLYFKNTEIAEPS